MPFHVLKVPRIRTSCGGSGRLCNNKADGTIPLDRSVARLCLGQQSTAH